MSLNLSKYGAEMQKAWRAVCDGKDETNWALYGYEGSTFDLKLVATGEDGMEELMEELNASRIMYAFVKVDDPNTSLPKFVLINWQGESAPATRKGKAATHLRDVEKYFHGHHVTVDARNEDDVVVEEIIAKVSKASAGKFNFGERHFMQEDAAPGPVGTCHQRIIPQKELPSLDEREKFWTSEETKERERKEQDKTRRLSEAKRLDSERREREEREALAREEAIKEREKKISVIRKAEEASLVANVAGERFKWERQKNQEDEEEDEARRRRGEEMKRMRSEEVRQLISQRSGNAKAVFERHSSVGQMNFRRRSNAAGISEHKEQTEHAGSRNASAGQRGSNGASHSAEARHAEVEDEEEEDVVVVPPPDSFGNDDRESDRVPMENGSALARGAEAGLAKAVHCPPPDITTNTESKPDILKDVGGSKAAPDITQGSGSSSGLDRNGGEQTQGSDGKPKLHPKYGMCALALYDYQAADETEISFDPGQVVTHIDQIDSGWWQGVGPDGSYGLFPANYVEVIDPSELVAD